MSVRVGDRKDGKLQILNKARILKRYTLALLKNDKYFPKSVRWMYAQPIHQEMRAACLCVKRANAVRVSDTVNRENEFKYRRMQQVEAYAHFEALLDLIDDVYLARYISGRQAEHWTKLIVETEELLKAWSKSDLERYSNKG